MNTHIGQIIRQLRIQRGWSLDHLAELAHSSKSNLSNLERGEQNCSQTLLRSLARAFEMRISEMYLLLEQMDDVIQHEGMRAAAPLDTSEWMAWAQLYFSLNAERRALLFDFLNRWK